MNQKIVSVILLTLMVTWLFSCSQNGQESHEQPQPQRPTQSPSQPQPQMAAATAVHTVEAREIIQGNTYTYINVKEGESLFWIATRKSEVEPGETFTYSNPLEMRDFTSKELQRTFETIYFVSRISKDASTPAARQPETSHQKPAVEISDIAIEPIEGGITIGELFTNRESYGKKIVRVKGKVTKVNPQIMKRNWIHLQDGTGGPGTNDLVVTTQDNVSVGDVVTFAGMITLDKDFGAGYAYELLMEDARLDPSTD